MILFEVRIDGVWVKAPHVFISKGKGTLHYALLDKTTGIAGLSDWRISQELIDDPDFKLNCLEAVEQMKIRDFYKISA